MAANHDVVASQRHEPTELTPRVGGGVLEGTFRHVRAANAL